MSKEPQLVGYHPETGKPRMRVPTDYMPKPFARLGAYNGQALFQPKLSAKAEVKLGREAALRNVQALERNNELVRGGLDRKAHTVVGASMFPIATPDLRWLKQDIEWGLEYRQAVSSVWNEWGDDDRMLCDAEGHYKINGLLWQGFRTMVGGDAEVAGYIGYDRERADRYNHKWATYVHLLDPARIGTPPNRDEQDGSIFEGRELDPLGRMTGIHCLKRHPSDGGKEANEWEFIPRETEHGRPMAFHWFIKRRAALNRAISPLVTSLEAFENYGTLDRALLESAAVNTVISSYIKTTMDPQVVREYLSPSSDDGPSVFDLKLDAYDKMDLKVGNKRIPVLGPNDELVMENLKGSLVDSDAFRKAFLRNFASAIGISVESLTLDYTDSTYSSIRASALNAMLIVDFERRMYGGHVANLITNCVIEEAFALGILKAPRGAPSFYEARAAYTRVRWIGPGMGWVDPLKEAKGATERWTLGAETLDGIAGAQGFDALENLQTKAIEISLMKQLGIPVPGQKDPGQEDTSANEDPDAGDAKPGKKGSKRDGDGDGVVDEEGNDDAQP